MLNVLRCKTIKGNFKVSLFQFIRDFSLFLEENWKIKINNKEKNFQG